MRENRGWYGVVLGCVAAFMAIQWATSNEAFSDENPMGGGGHDVPTPFEMVNRTFELADGEIYALKGTVMMKNRMTDEGFRLQPYFQVDLSRHCWLASSRRKQAPYYILEGSTSAWRALRGREVKILAKARGNVAQGKISSYFVSLDVIAVDSNSFDSLR